MPPWLSTIISVQNKESKFHSSRWIQLATVGLDNTPRVRTVVFRGWSDSYEMEILTDKRSMKYFELEANNSVEICWLFSKSKYQFRLRGTSRTDLGIDCINHWEQLDKKNKLMWTWPSPGNPFTNKKIEQLDLQSVPSKLSNFILLKIDIFYVDQLILESPIHFRRRWTRNPKHEWNEERINP